MRTSAFVFSLILLCFCTSLSMAGTVAVTSSAAFTPGLTGSWSFTYAASSGAPDLLIQSVTIDLSPTHLKFDTYAGADSTFGSLTALDVGGYKGSDVITGLSGVSATGKALDGGQLVTFSFLDFAPGDAFQFTADVDNLDPTLLALLNCSGKTGLALLGCNLTNAGRTTTNNANLLLAQTVGPNQMAGAVVTFTFGGDKYNTTPVQGVFQRVTLRDIVLGLAQGEGVVVFNTNAGTNADVSNPEPASVATLGAGLGLLLALAVRRRTLP